MKRIVFLSPYTHFGHYSGARNRVDSICDVLLKDPRFKVICISPWTPKAGVDHIYFKLEGGIFEKTFSYFKVIFILLRLRPDFVFSESPIAPISFGCYRLIHVIHDAKFSTKFSRKGGQLVRLLHWVSARISFRVLTVSNTERERLMLALNIQRGKIIVSYNGISDAWFRPRDLSTNLHHRFDIIYVSNFAKHKGHIDLLRVIKNQDWRIAFVGADFGTLNVCIEEVKSLGLNVSFYSNLSEDDLIRKYDESKIFAFPSKLEGFGIPYLEARARGLPIVAQDIQVFRELQERLGGELTNFENSSSALEKIKDSLAGISPKYDLQQFSWTRVVDDLLNNELLVK